MTWFVLAAVMFVTLFFVAAPYGRHTRSRWGPTIDSRVGWVAMEATAPALFAASFVLGSNSGTATVLVQVPYTVRFRW